MEVMWLTNDLAYAEHPARQDLWALDKLTFRSLVNLRLPTEERTPTGDAERLGLHTFEIPIESAAAVCGEHLDALDQALRGADRFPALVHAPQGARAGVLALAWLAADQSWTVERLDAEATRLGLDIPDAARSWVLGRSGAYEEVQPVF
jgi:protein tyrosine phosphatase (PTP) superfamily phosphohydrolase (DUF442 family)